MHNEIGSPKGQPNMKTVTQLGVFGSAAVAGWILGGYAPKWLVPDAWRLPISIVLIAVGIALALIVIH